MSFLTLFLFIIEIQHVSWFMNKQMFMFRLNIWRFFTAILRFFDNMQTPPSFYDMLLKGQTLSFLENISAHD